MIQETTQPFLRLFMQMGGLVVCLFVPLWFNPLSATPFEPPKVAVFQTITGSIALAAVVSAAIDRRNETFSTRIRHWLETIGNPLALPIIGFGAAYTLATVTSVDWRLSLWGPADNPHGLVTLLCGIAYFLLMADVLKTRGQIDRFVNVLLLGSVPIALYGVVQYLGLDPLDWVANPISSSFSTMGNPNFLGAYLGIVVPFTLSRVVLSPERNRQWRYSLVLLLQVVCLWLTLARGAWLGLIGGWFSFLAVLGWRWQSRAFLIASFSVLLLGLGLFVTMNTSVLRPWFSQSETSSPEMNLPPPKIDTASVQARIVIWGDTIGLIADRWWLGYGPATFVQVFAARYPAALAETEGPDIWVSDPHNLFLRQLVDAGVAGLVTFLWILVAFYRLVRAVFARKADRPTQVILMAVSGSAIAFLIQALFNPVLIVHFSLFWLDLALGAAVYHSVGSAF